MADTPNPAEVLGRLEPVTLVLRNILKKSITRARTFLNNRGEWDDFYFATRIRLEARRFLQLQTLEISEDGDETSTPPVESNHLPNIGLQFFVNGILTKVLKRSGDPDCPLPVPNSLRRIGFYNQQKQYVPNRNSNGKPFVSDLNTLYLWDCNDAHHFSSLALACPSEGGRSKANVAWHWIIDIPILSVVREPTITYGEDERQQVLSEEIAEISRPQEDTETGTEES